MATPFAIHIADELLAQIRRKLDAYDWDLLPDTGGWTSGVGEAGCVQQPFLHRIWQLNPFRQEGDLRKLWVYVLPCSALVRAPFGADLSRNPRNPANFREKDPRCQG